MKPPVRPAQNGGRSRPENRSEYFWPGVQVIGVHTPETENEKIATNVVREIKRNGMTYSVMIDPQGENWKRWQQQYWPTVYLIDKQGYVRSYWVGELNGNRAGGEAIMGAKIEALLREPYSRKP